MKPSEPGNGHGSILDDLVQPFQVEGLNLRGRLVRLGTAVDTVVRQHAYPGPIGGLLAEGLALAATLAGALKYDGVFSLQTKSDGPMRLMVADVTSAGDLRGYAQFDTDRLLELGDRADDRSFRRLMGKGYLAFTVDQGPHTDRYQGIVDLDGSNFVECAQHYFRQSEQLETGIKLAAGHAGDREVGWRAGGLMVQRLPANDDDEDWRRALVLMESCTRAELLDQALDPHDLLYRLFHEDGVRVYRPHPLRARCRCSRGRAESVLRLLPEVDLAEMVIDGQVIVTCQFCNSSHVFDETEVRRLRAS
ncbi:MAG: Hsp33 family molecular chaperone HslO [Proteobacteria bacterium]|nr:Hsp33 family molecular chaperone HslO [Pseudomonadota bacterium]